MRDADLLSAARPRPPSWRAGLPLVLVLVALAAASCAMPGAGEARAREKLRSIGLEIWSEDEAGIPPPERGKTIPVRVIDGSLGAVLPPHPAGYLLAGVGGESGSSPAEILAALASWEPGSVLELRVRRNPWLGSGAEWWEQDVRAVLPSPQR